MLLFVCEGFDIMKVMMVLGKTLVFGCLLCCGAARGDVATVSGVRVVDLVDFASHSGVVRPHRGATAECVYEKEGAVDYAHITYKIPPGWVDYFCAVPIPEGTSQLEVTWRAPDGKELGAGLTLTDSAGQNYQFQTHVPAGPSWGTVRIDL